MIRANAQPIVASVVHLESLGHWPLVELVGKPVRHLPVTFAHDVPVPALIELRARPFPAAGRFGNPRPEELLNGVVPALCLVVKGSYVERLSVLVKLSAMGGAVALGVKWPVASGVAASRPLDSDRLEVASSFPLRIVGCAEPPRLHFAVAFRPSARCLHVFNYKTLSS